MKQHYKATGSKAKRDHLSVYVTLEVGTTVRFVTVNVPWGLLIDQQQGILNGLEREYVARIEADADVLYLPLEKSD